MLTVGDPAPEFTGTDQHRGTVRLEDYADKTVVLYFYPKDDTPGCTKEACSFRDNIDTLTDQDVHVIGVSADTVESHKAFAEKYDLPFPLIADPDKKIIDAYDVRGSFGNAKRVTYVIRNGEIVAAYEKVDTETHAEDILSDL